MDVNAYQFNNLMYLFIYLLHASMQCDCTSEQTAMYKVDYYPHNVEETNKDTLYCAIKQGLEASQNMIIEPQ